MDVTIFGNVSMRPFRKLSKGSHPQLCHSPKVNVWFLLFCLFVFSQGVGRRRSSNLRRQHSSHFCLCHEEVGSSSTVSSSDMSVYKADFTVKQATDNVPGSGRRFPRNHRQKSAEAASAQTEQFMWFGRHDASEKRPASRTSRPKDTLVFALLHTQQCLD